MKAENTNEKNKKNSYYNQNSHYNNKNSLKFNKKRANQGRKKMPHDPLRIIPIGGLREIGKNMTLFQYKNDIIIVDCGFSFPDDEMLGIDVVIPDFSYLRENRSKIKGLVVTHGHEDHIGAIPYLLQEFDIPVYAPALARGLINNKLKEKRINADINLIESGDKIKLGEFQIEAVRTNHSIADSNAFYIKCKGGKVFHTGDFKVDYSPLDGKSIDLTRFAEIGKEGIDVLLCDSTNVLKHGYTPSEKIVLDSMNKIFKETDKRIIIATFSSNIYRIKYFMEASIAKGRKIAISGRSMENVINIATELGYLNIPKSAIVDIREISNIPDGNLTIVTTGSQGEPMSALTRMANDSHKAVKLKKGDVVVFSSSPIPGNEKTITNVVNRLYEKEVTVYLSDFVDIHVSGHACSEELKLIHTLIKPKYFIPVHGEYRHLVEHGKLAASIGMSKGNIFIMSNGDCLVLKGNRAINERGYSEAEDILVDGIGIGDVGSIVLKDRKQLSESGLIVVSLVIDRDSFELLNPPKLISKGFIYVKENASLLEEARSVVLDTLDILKYARNKDEQYVQNKIKENLRSFIFKRTRRNPVILSMITYI